MLATGSLRFCGCPLMTVPHSPADHAQPAPKGKRREVVVAGKRVKTVDVHAHCCVPKAMAVIGHPLEAPGLLMDGSAQGPDQLATRIAAMDAQGIDVEALSINPYWYKAGKDQSAELIRIQNETLVEFCAANPERFVAYATAALQHPELAAEQVEHAVKKLGFRGVSVGGSVAGEELANPRFHPFWKKCEELDVLVFLHPTGTRELEASGRLAGSGLLSNTIGNPLETTIALSHLIFEGTLDKFPGLKVIAAHGGGYLPSYADRSDHACMVGPRGCNAEVKLKKKPTEYLKQLYFDSLIFSPEAIRHLAAQVGASQIVLGSDYPYPWQLKPVDHIFASASLSDEEKANVLGNTAARLLNIKA